MNGSLEDLARASLGSDCGVLLPADFLVEKRMEGGRPCLVKAPAGAEVPLCSQHTQRMKWLLCRVHCGPELARKETGEIKWDHSRSISRPH